MDAWLTFFSIDTPEEIERFLEVYPDFKRIYEEIYQLCLNIERVMEMFSKELQMLDENTVKYMVEEMREEIDAQKVQLDVQSQTIDEQSQTIDALTQTNDAQSQTIDAQSQMIEQLQMELLNLKSQMNKGNIFWTAKNNIRFLKLLDMSLKSI